MVVLKEIELKNTHHLMDKNVGVLLRTLMGAFRRYRPVKIILEKNANIILHVPPDVIDEPKLNQRVNRRSPAEVIGEVAKAEDNANKAGN